MTRTPGRKYADVVNEKRHLILAAVLAGVAGLGLVVLGWWIIDWQFRADWGRLTEASWWTSGVVRALGFLAFGKVGFKLALAAVLGTVAAVAWWKGRKRQS